MGFLVPILMCLAFIFAWILLAKWILALDKRMTKKSLLSAKRLDMKSMAALIYLYFGGKLFLYSRWFPKRSPAGTVYREVPCVLIFGKKIFVLEVCSLPGTFHNTDQETWTVIPPAEYTKKKEVQIKSPLFLAKERAALLKELLDALSCPFEFSVEPMAVLTEKDHQCTYPLQSGLYTVNEALAHLARLAPKTKTERKKMKKINGLFFAVFNRYSLSRGSAIARNNKMRQKKK